jgi:hypothetical protein
MKIGTKSLLFGIHQFILHPILVTVAWRKLYGVWPTLRQIACIFLHDIGYFGKEDMDGDEGRGHPLLGGLIAEQWFGRQHGDLVRYHSRAFAAAHGQPESLLCVPDKLSILLYPRWLYLLLGNLTGEIAEYKIAMGLASLDDSEWLRCLRLDIVRWATGAIHPQCVKRLDHFEAWGRVKNKPHRVRRYLRHIPAGGEPKGLAS